MHQTAPIPWPDSIAARILDARVAVAFHSTQPLNYPQATIAPKSTTEFFQAGDTVDTHGIDDAKERFSRIVLPHLPAAYSLARSLTRNSSDAEDVVQEACLRAYRAIGATTVANPRAWVLTIVHNTAYNWLRANRPAAIIAVDNLEAAEQAQTRSVGTENETPEAAVIAKTEGVRLESAIKELPALFREVLALREIEGLSYREIAEVTGVPIGTVMSRLARARDRLISAIGRNPS